MRHRRFGRTRGGLTAGSRAVVRRAVLIAQVDNGIDRSCRSTPFLAASRGSMRSTRASSGRAAAPIASSRGSVGGRVLVRARLRREWASLRADRCGEGARAATWPHLLEPSCCITVGASRARFRSGSPVEDTGDVIVGLCRGCVPIAPRDDPLVPFVRYRPLLGRRRAPVRDVPCEQAGVFFHESPDPVSSRRT